MNKILKYITLFFINYFQYFISKENFFNEG
jgi:hypothetical protein